MFRIQFETDNAAFSEESGGDAMESIRLLHDVADRLARGERYGRLFNANGNRVGSFSFEYPTDDGATSYDDSSPLD